MNSREQFETWAKSQYMPLRVASTGEYWVETTQSAWEAWQASRAVIRVDLPHLFPFYREGVTEALLAHGIKVNQWGPV